MNGTERVAIIEGNKAYHLLQDIFHTGPEGHPAKEVGTMLPFNINQHLIEPFLSAPNSQFAVGVNADRVASQIIEPALSKCVTENTEGPTASLIDSRVKMSESIKNCVSQSVKDILAAKNIDERAVLLGDLTITNLKIDGQK